MARARVPSAPRRLGSTLASSARHESHSETPRTVSRSRTSRLVPSSQGVQGHVDPAHSRHLSPRVVGSSASSTGPTPELPSHDGRGSQGFDEPSTEIIMAIDLRDSSTMGCAFFETGSGVLSLSTDVAMADLDVAEQFLAHVQPTMVLVSGRAAEHLLVFLEDKAAVDQRDGSPVAGFILRVMASSDFSLRTAHERLFALQTDTPISEEPRQGSLMDVTVNCASRDLKLIKCGIAIDLESQVSVTCAGALLSEIHRRRSAEYFPEGGESGGLFEVAAIEMFSLSDSVYITQETMLSLQILQSEQHPNSQISGGVQSAHGSKESLSVYGLFHHLTGTPQGRASLRRLFFRPTQNIELITERQQFIALFVSPESADCIKQASKILRKVGNARRALAQLKKGAESPSMGQTDKRGAWSMLKRFATHTLKLREVIVSIPRRNDVKLLTQMVDCMEPRALASVGDMIEKTIDFEDSKERQRSCVRAGVDPQLDELKRVYDGMSSLLTQVIDQMRAHIPEWARRYVRSCIFLPQLGFLTVVDPDPETGNGGYEGEGGDSDQWEKVFKSDGVVCYKNKLMKELDGRYGDMYCEIGDREVKIIHDLAKQVLRYEDTLTTVSDLCGQFDAMLALAIGADKYNWTRPQITDDSRIWVDGGRHPLQELVVPCFIPNDCHLMNSSIEQDETDGTSARVLILTGPNHSGKSVYLKQVATIVYLAQVGSYVPADRAVLGLTDRIFARLSTRESVSRAESAFAIDLKQVAHAVRGAGPRSLVLIDEFGKGTNSDDGAGLLTAMIDHMYGNGNDCPNLLVATHFHEVFEGGYLRHHQHLHVAHFEIEINKDNQQAEDHLTYLFKLAHGHSSSSFGCRCAALNGVPGAVVRRAEAISQLIARNEDLVTACAQLSSDEKERLERAEGAARRFLEADMELASLGSQATVPGESPEGAMRKLLNQILLGTEGSVRR